MAKKILVIVLIGLGFSASYAASTTLTCDLKNGSTLRVGTKSEAKFSLALTHNWSGRYHLIPGSNNQVTMTCTFPAGQQGGLSVHWKIKNSNKVKCGTGSFSECNQFFIQSRNFKWGANPTDGVTVKFELGA